MPVDTEETKPLVKIVVESNRTGEVTVLDAPAPTVRRGGILVQTQASLVSAGTERQMVEMARKSLLGKARQRPDLVKQVLDKAQRDGVGATISAVRSRLESPVPLGYSSAGRVIAVGAGAEAFRVGDLVACAGGGYASHAEVVYVPKNLAVVLPPGVDAESGAFATVGSVALHGLRLSGVVLGDSVVVLGLGLVGLLAVQLAHAAGCRVVGFDPKADRAELARSVGAEVALTDLDSLRSELDRVSGGAGADAVIVAAGAKSSEPVELAGELARDRGSVVVIGLVEMNVPRRVYYEKELSLRVSRSYGPGRYDPSYEEQGHDYPIGFVRWTEQRNMAAFVQQVAAGGVQTGPLVTHRFPIRTASDAYDLILGGQEPSLGVVITYPAAERSSVTDPLPMVEPWAQAVRSAPVPGVIRVGFLGAGAFAADTLLPVVTKLPEFSPVAVCTASGLSAELARSKFGFERATSEQADLIADPTIDLVAIATRHDLHAEQVVAALDAGKHVFVEKPLCLNEDELGKVIQAAARTEGTTGGLLMVGYNRRFAPLMRKLRAFISSTSEPVAAVYRVNGGHIPPDHWVQDPEVGGRRIIGEACHFVDALTYLCSSVPVLAYAHGLPNGKRYVDDNVMITLEFENGSVGTIVYVANGSKAFPKERVEIYGDGMTGVIDNFRRAEFVDTRRRVERTRVQDKGHHGEWVALARALTTGGESPIPFAEIVATSRTTFAIVESLATGAPVQVGGLQTDA